MSEFYFATLLLGVIPLFAKLITWPAGSIILFRGALSVFFLFIFLKITGQRVRLKRKIDYLILLGIGALFGVHWLTLFYSVQFSNVAVGTISFFTFPVMITLLEPLFTKVKPKVVDLLSAVLVFIGMWMIVPEFSLDNSVTMGVLLGLLSAFVFSLRMILSRKTLEDYSSSVVIFYQFMAVVLVSLPFLGQVRGLDFSASNLIYILILGLVFSVFAHTLYMRGLSRLKARVVGVLSTIEVVYAVIAAYLILNEVPSGGTLWGGSLILAVVLWETWRHFKSSVES